MHVFVVGRQGSPTVAAVRAVVHDWSAVGLVAPSVWIDLADGRSAGGTEPAPGATGLRIDGGLAGRVELRSWLPRNPGPARVVALQSIAEPRGSVPVEDVYAFLQSVRLPPGAPLVNLLVPADGTEAVADAIFDSQVNVLVQPVDAADPQAVIEPLGTGSPTFAMHAAAALCTAAGLWTGMAAAPLDAEQPWSGVGVAVGRAYLRRLDATPVLDRLADEVYGTTGTLPITRTQFGEPMALVAPAAQLAAAEATGYAVLGKHAATTRFRPPPPFQPPAPERLGFGAALKMFFGFLRRAISGAPQAWANEVVRAARGRLEQGATRFFFGDKSGYQVVLTGLSATTGSGVDQAGALQEAAVGFLSRNAAPGSEEPVTRVPQLWDDTVRTVAALADGGDPDPSIPLPGEGMRLVIDNPARLCPPPGTPPFRVPHGLPGSENGPIEADDPYHAIRVDRLLEGHAQEAERSVGHPGHVERMATIAQLRHQLAAWVGQRRSAMWAISSGLAGELDKARAAYAEMITAGQGESDVDLDAPLAAQRRVRTRVLIWLVVLVVAVVVSVVLRVVDVISTNLCIWIVVGVLLVCLIGAFLTFVRGQRALMHAIHRMRVAAKRREWLAGNAVRLTQEMYRLSSIYRQSRVWSQVVAEYVNAPFGAPEQTPQEQAVPARLTGDLPLAVTVATATYVPQAHEPVVYQARSQLLRKDWLNTSIASRRRLVIDHVKQQTGRDLENRLSTDADLVPGGPLRSFLEALRLPEIKTQARGIALARLVEGIRSSGMGDRLLPAVRVEAGAIRSEQSWAAMTDALLTPQGQLSYDGFSPTGITNRAPAVGRSFLATDSSATVSPPLFALPTAPTQGRHQLDRFIVRWDLTHPVAPEELTYFTPASADTGGVGAGEQIIDVRS